jgi:hypothetical protein
VVAPSGSSACPHQVLRGDRPRRLVVLRQEFRLMTSLFTRVAAVPLAVAVSLAGLTGCLAPSAPSEDTRPPEVIEAAPAAASADDAINRVLAISIDGLNPRAIRKLGSKGAPSFHRLMREGAYTLNARTEYEMTKTLPNHTGMLTGRRINAKKHGHGIDFNSDTGTTVHKQAGRYVASVFDVVHDRGGRTALFSAKTKFKLYQRTWNTHGRSDKVGKNNGKKKIDRVTLDTNNTRLVRAVNADLKASPRTFTFLHLSLPDVAGHKHGFMSKKYLTAVKETDRLLGTVLNTVAAKPSLKAHTLVVLTADHGGNGASHGNRTKLQNYRVPFMAWGPGVDKGRNLYAINTSVRSPKTSRPSYAGKQPIRNGDVANLATDVLDLPPVPGSKLDRPRSLNVFGT